MIAMNAMRVAQSRGGDVFRSWSGGGLVVSGSKKTRIFFFILIL